MKVGGSSPAGDAVVASSCWACLYCEQIIRGESGGDGEADTEESSPEGGGNGSCAGSTAAAALAGRSDRALNTKRRLGGGRGAGVGRGDGSAAGGGDGAAARSYVRSVSANLSL